MCSRQNGNGQDFQNLVDTVKFYVTLVIVAGIVTAATELLRYLGG